MILRNNEWIEVAAKAYEAQQQEKHYSKLKDAYIDKLKELSEGQPSHGDIYKFIQITRKGTFDYPAIPELKVIDLEPYRKPDVICWKLTNDNIII